MNELFHKSLAIREDGTCQHHPEVVVLERGAHCIGNCHLCALACQQNNLRSPGKDPNDTFSTTATSSSFFGSSAASLELFGSPASAASLDANHNNHNKSSNKHRQQQQQFLDSILSRWVQVHDDPHNGQNLQQSIAFSTPLIIHELRRLVSKVEQQEQTIQKQAVTIQDLQHTMKSHHATTQELLQSILQTVTSAASTAATAVDNNGNTSNNAELAAAVGPQITMIKEISQRLIESCQSLSATELLNSMVVPDPTTTGASFSPPTKKDNASVTNNRAVHHRTTAIPKEEEEFYEDDEEDAVTDVDIPIKIDVDTTKENGNNIPAAINTTSAAAAAAAAAPTPHIANTRKKQTQASPSRQHHHHRPRGGGSLASTRSIDSSVKQPIPRHDSNRSFSLRDLHPSAAAVKQIQQKQQLKKEQKAAQQQQKLKYNPHNDQLQRDLSASQPIMSFYSETEPLPHSEYQKMSSSQNQIAFNPKSEIALDGSHHSLSYRHRHDLPDITEIFEEGIGAELASVKRNKFRVPSNYGGPKTPTNANNNNSNEKSKSNHKSNTNHASNDHDGNDNNSRPMEIILEAASPTSQPRDSVRKLIPTTPMQVGLEIDPNTGLETLDDVVDALHSSFAVDHDPHTSNKRNSLMSKNGDITGIEHHMSFVSLGAASEAPPDDSDLSESLIHADDEDDDDDEDEHTHDDDDDDDDEHTRDEDDEDEEMDEDDEINHTHDDDDEDSQDDDEEQEQQHSDEESSYHLQDEASNDYAFEDLPHVTKHKMIDLYGDRGTYTGTVGPDNDPTGFGTMKYDSGRFYKGEWKKGRWNGKGTLLNANGDSYQGDFVMDARHGKGVYRFTSGDVYEGDFYEDNRHGKGKFKFHNGSVYNGEFCMGSFEGFGRYDFDGGFYEGEWKRDEYYGKGKLQYKDGSNYRGRFKKGSAHGFGEERLADGTVRCGLWKRGEFLQECSEEEYQRIENSKSAHTSGAVKKKRHSSTRRSSDKYNI